MLRVFVFVSMICIFYGCSTEKNTPSPIQERNSISLSHVSKELSLSLTWDSSERKAYMQKEDYYAIVQPESDIIWVRGEPYKMEFPAYIKNKEVYIPLRTHLEDLKTLFSYQNKAVEDIAEMPDIAYAPEPLLEINNYTPPQTLAGFLILLDPGHGGKDSGAIAHHGAQEKVFNLDIANKLADILKERQAKILMTRNQDIFLSLKERIDFANQNKPDCLISIHLNSALNKKASGFEVWISPNHKTKHSKSSLLLARFIRASLQKNTPLVDRGIRKNTFRIIHETHVPSVLVECCFLSNPKDLSWISEEENRSKIARCLAQGIFAYYLYQKRHL